MSKTPTPAEIALAKMALRDMGKALLTINLTGQGIHLGGAVALRRLTKRVNTLYGLDLPVPTFGQAFLLVAAARNLRAAIFQPISDRTLERLEPESGKVLRERTRAKERAAAEGVKAPNLDVLFDGAASDLGQALAAALRARTGSKVAADRGEPAPGFDFTKAEPDGVNLGPRRRPSTPPVTEESATP